jgi:hypothetical protein
MMDPNAALDAIVEQAQFILDHEDRFPPEAIDLAEHALGLHDWLVKGGAGPTEWGVL